MGEEADQAEREAPASAVPSGAVLGGVTESRNDVTSNIEERVRQLVRDAGYKVPKQKMCVWVEHPNWMGRLLPLTPDIVLIKHRLAIEVDPLSRTDHHGYSHDGEREKDQKRNDLLTAAGWTVLRLRLGADESAAIGDRDVLCASSSITAAVSEAFLSAIDDHVHSRPAQVRFVPRKQSAAPRKPATRLSSVQRISEFRYADDGHIFWWFPTEPVSGEEKVYLRLAVNGRYLCTHDKPALFIREVGLHQVPQEQWKDRLAGLLAETAPTDLGSTKYPWGDTLLLANETDPLGLSVVERCEWKASIDTASIEFSSNYGDMVEHSENALLNLNGDELVWLHPAAYELGYRMKYLHRLTGYAGPYQRIGLSRYE